MAIVYGTNASETINGFDGVTDFADTIYGYAGSDTIFGLGGNDWIVGGLGSDTINGGNGIDTASYSDSSEGVTVSLAIGTTGKGGTAAGDTLTSIENLYGSNFGDRLTGDSADNTLAGMGGHDFLVGGGGADVLSGGAGDDVLVGGSGADTLYGGDGLGDQLAYNNSTAAVFVSLLDGTATGGDATGDTFSGIEDLTGSSYHDALVGNDTANSLLGLGGHDILKGFGGADFIDGGDGDDILDGGTEGDYLTGYAGNDTYYVDSNLDTVVESGDGTFDTLLTSVSYTLSDGCDIELLRTTNDAGFGSIDLTGNASSQEVRGNAGSNMIAGGLGNDTLVGLGGEDAFIFNTALGASNIDTISDYSVAQDQMRLDNAIFTNLFATEGNWLTADEFTIGAAAADANDRIIYNSASGALFYDADGDGDGAAMQFATLSTGLALTSNEFYIV